MRLMTESDGERRLRFRYSVLLTGLVLVSPAATLLESRTVAWGWLAVGAVGLGIVFGPFARTATAERIDGLAGEPGLRKGLIIVLLAICIWSVMAVVQPSAVTVSSFVVGGLAALLVV